MIVDLGYATRERVDEVIDEARTAGRPADELLVDRRLVNADQLSRALAERYGLDHIDLNVFHVDMGAANLLSVAAARRYLAVPVGYVDPQTLLVAVADPANVFAVDDIQLITGLSCKVAVAAADDIEALIRRLNTLESAVTEAIDEEGEDGELGEVSELARVGRRRAGDQARLFDPRPGGDRGRVRRPLRARRGRDAGQVPGRRRPRTRRRGCRSG